jgi:hypothetical protein
MEKQKNIPALRFLSLVMNGKIKEIGNTCLAEIFTFSTGKSIKQNEASQEI